MDWATRQKERKNAVTSAGEPLAEGCFSVFSGISSRDWSPRQTQGRTQDEKKHNRGNGRNEGDGPVSQDDIEAESQGIQQKHERQRREDKTNDQMGIWATGVHNEALTVPQALGLVNDDTWNGRKGRGKGRGTVKTTQPQVPSTRREVRVCRRREGILQGSLDPPVYLHLGHVTEVNAAIRGPGRAQAGENETTAKGKGRGRRRREPDRDGLTHEPFIFSTRGQAVLSGASALAGYGRTDAGVLESRTTSLQVLACVFLAGLERGGGGTRDRR